MTRLFRSKSCSFADTRITMLNNNNPKSPNPNQNPNPSLFLTQQYDSSSDEEEDEEWENGSNPISTPFINAGSREVGITREEKGQNRNYANQSHQFSVLAILVTALRKSLITCSVETEDGSSLDISGPTEVQHLSHVTFDRFNGFLGLPAELQPEVPRRVPSASASVFGVSAKSMQCSYDERGNSVPTILLMMQKRLYMEGGLHAEGIFRINAENSQEEHVRNQLNSGVVPRGIDIHCLAGLIKAWLRELPTGVLDSLTPEQVMHCNTEDECTQLVKQLPPTEAALLDAQIQDPRIQREKVKNRRKRCSIQQYREAERERDEEEGEMGCKIRAVSDDESGGGGGVSNGSLREALLFTTMCIIGLPVEVHIKDGSVYSGIFHTARIENDYGVVLKKARMTKKGKSDANVANGGLIETLVVLSGDLVQVVAKGVLLPSDGLDGNGAGDNVEAVACSIPCPENEAKIIKSGKIDADRKNFDKISRRSAQNNNGFAHGLTRTTHDGKVPKKVENMHEEEKMGPSGLEHGLSIESRKRGGIYAAKTEEHSKIPVNGRQVGENRSQGGQEIYKEKLYFHKKETIREVQSSRLSSDECITQVKPTEEIHAKVIPKPFTNGVSHDNPASSAGKIDNPCSERPISAGNPEAISYGVSTSLHAAVDVSSESGLRSLAAPTAMFPPQSLVSNRNTKEFKLNPEAKVFSPSFLNSRSASPQPPATSTIVSMAYMPNNAPVVQVAAAQPEFGISPFAPRPSLPAKFVPYTNLTAGNAGSGSQYAQPIVGHAGSRAQPVRFAGQYHPVQAGPTYMHPNSQAVMIGRSGQLFYVHPVSHDVIHGAAAISPVPARPLLNPHQIQFPKHQGTQAMQLCVPPPPFVAGGGQQSIVVPTQFPLLQPPFPANRPIHIPGSNGLYTTAKFP